MGHVSANATPRILASSHIFSVAFGMLDILCEIVASPPVRALLPASCYVNVYDGPPRGQHTINWIIVSTKVDTAGSKAVAPWGRNNAKGNLTPECGVRRISWEGFRTKWTAPKLAIQTPTLSLYMTACV
jgi:hypothetical protein